MCILYTVLLCFTFHPFSKVVLPAKCCVLWTNLSWMVTTAKFSENILIICRLPISYPHYLSKCFIYEFLPENSHLLKMAFPRGADHILFLCFTCLMTRGKCRYFPRNQLPTAENQSPHFRYISLAPLILYLSYHLLCSIARWVPGQSSWKETIFTHWLWLFISFFL